MATLTDKVPENVNGRYYVDRSCIYCDLCRETAPNNFKEINEMGWAAVFKQPENPEEEEACREAKEGCPTESIGDNGN
ncbi:MAG TPA: ferredoxin [Methylomirabilota bacterium]|nr:ferredoxin [Methylomirabilota bacterium]